MKSMMEILQQALCQENLNTINLHYWLSVAKIQVFFLHPLSLPCILRHLGLVAQCFKRLIRLLLLSRAVRSTTIHLLAHIIIILLALLLVRSTNFDLIAHLIAHLNILIALALLNALPSPLFQLTLLLTVLLTSLTAPFQKRQHRSLISAQRLIGCERTIGCVRTSSELFDGFQHILA